MMQNLKYLVLGLALATAMPLAAQITPTKTWANRELLTAVDLNTTLANLASSALNRNGGTMLGTLTSAAVAPSAHNTYDLGSSSFRYKDGYFAGSVQVGNLIPTTIGVTQNTMAHSGANYTASGSMTWTVEAGDQITSVYMVYGSQVTWSFGLVNTSTSGAAAAELRATLPANYTAAGAQTTGDCAVADNATDGFGVWVVNPGNTYVQIFRNMAGSNWTSPATNSTSIRCTVVFFK